MQSITKSEYEFLVSRGLLILKHGKYYDQLVICNKQANKKKKQRYVTDYIYEAMVRLQKQLKQQQKQQKSKKVEQK